MNKPWIRARDAVALYVDHGFEYLGVHEHPDPTVGPCDVFFHEPKGCEKQPSLIIYAYSSKAKGAGQMLALLGDFPTSRVWSCNRNAAGSYYWERG